MPLIFFLSGLATDIMLSANVSALIPALSSASCKPSISDILFKISSFFPEAPIEVSRFSTSLNLSNAKILLSLSVVVSEAPVTLL